jgi:trans-AT polyketide synthase, acyltransferase and oxidoreductase domains
MIATLPIAPQAFAPEYPATIAPESLGASSFRRRYNIRYAYLTGAMYKGIASKEMVVAMGETGLLGFLGTGGMTLNEIERDIFFIQGRLRGRSFGMNLICNINHPQIEMDTVELYLRRDITCVEAAAFMQMTPALVYYRVSGLHRNAHGGIECRHKIIAKVSRPEIARAFLSPPPAQVLERLLEASKITPEQKEMASRVPMSHDICVEADSGGHTDQGVASVLLPAMQNLREEIEKKYRYAQRIHMGLAGGIGTPQAAGAAFMMGADFVVTGSINQCTVEAGTSDCVKDLLQGIDVQDTDYAPAGDMFELGARVQVLKKGVFFPARANKLFMLYSHYDTWESIPEKIRDQIESKYFQRSFASVWEEVAAYHTRKGQMATLEKARANLKHKLALCFRWYFGYTSRLALAGDERNRVDFQVHTGPALGAFNQWVKGTELESWRNRRVGQIAEKLMHATADVLDGRIRKLCAPGAHVFADEALHA